MVTNTLAPIGSILGRSKAYLQQRRQQWGAGWSDDDRRRQDRWAEAIMAERYRVVAHLPPESEHNRGYGWAYELLDGKTGGAVYALPLGFTILGSIA